LKSPWWVQGKSKSISRRSESVSSLFYNREYGFWWLPYWVYVRLRLQVTVANYFTFQGAPVFSNKTSLMAIGDIKATESCGQSRSNDSRSLITDPESTRPWVIPIFIARALHQTFCAPRLTAIGLSVGDCQESEASDSPPVIQYRSGASRWYCVNKLMRSSSSFYVPRKHFRPGHPQNISNLLCIASCPLHSFN